MKTRLPRRRNDLRLHRPRPIRWPDPGSIRWNDGNGPAADLKANIASIDIEGTVGTVRLELDNWPGHKFTDMFTLLKVDGEWKIISKVFYLHPEK